MSNLKEDHAMKRTKSARRSCQTSHVLAGIIESNRMDKDGVNCSSSGVPTVDITPEAHHELQRTISEVARCVDGNDRLSTICIRYVEALNEKHRLAQQLREEKSLRTKVLETKDRLVAVCKRLQEQSTELRRESCYDDHEIRPIENRVVLRTSLGLVRKHLDLENFVDGDSKKEAKDNELKIRSLNFKDASTETEDVDCDNKSLDSVSVLEEVDKTCLNSVCPSEKFRVKMRVLRKNKLSCVTITQSDIPPEEDCLRKIWVSRASTDLTRR